MIYFHSYLDWWWNRDFTTLDILFRATYIHVKINEKELPPDGIQAEKEKMIINGRYKVLQKYMKKLSKVDFLILDEFLLTPISECERYDLLEVIQSSTDKKSTIYCSQWAPEGWLGKLGDGPLADAILDRIRNSSYTILLKGRSLREDYSKIK